MDDLDAQLVRLLTENAATPVAELARQLDVARSTAQARIERLERQGVIAGYTIRPGPALRGQHLRATVLLQIEPRATPSVLQRLSPLPEVEAAHTSTGRVDLIVEVSVAGPEDLDAILDKIGALPGVRSSESLIQLTTKIDRRI